MSATNNNDITIGSPVLYNGKPTQVISGPRFIHGCEVVLLAYVPYPVPIDSERLQMMDTYTAPTAQQQEDLYYGDRKTIQL